MFGPLAAFAATALIATSAPHSTVVGTVSSVAVLPTKTELVVTTAAGSSTIVVGVDAVVRERAAGTDWRASAVTSLSVGEPVIVILGASGIATEIDAEFGVVDTRAVTMEGDRFIGTDGVVRTFVGTAKSAGQIPLGAYVELRTDPSTGDAFDVTVAAHPFASASKVANAVAVTFSVRVPVNTPPSSTIYMATNAQNWTPNAIRMTPEPGNVWTAVVDLSAGTRFQYKYTRGAWTAGERDASGSEIPSRTLTVTSQSKAQAQSDIVARWADLPS